MDVMGSEKLFLCIMIVFILLTIYHHKEIKAAAKETFYAANWTGDPGANSIRPAQSVLRPVY